MARVTLDEVLEEAKKLPSTELEQLRLFLNDTSDLLLLGALVYILEQVHALHPNERRQLRDALNHLALEISSPIVKAASVQEVRGKYAHLPTSSAAFASRKAEEIALEDRRSRS